MKKWENFSKEELEQFVKESYSYAELCRKCGYNDRSGNATKSIKNMVEYYNFDISHFKGQNWNKNNFNYERFEYGRAIKSSEAIKAIAFIRGYQCERCKLSNWFEEPITLELHHIDGDNLNNELQNLQILCPNCHSQTENWRGRNISNKEPITEENFVQALQESSNIRQALMKLNLAAKGGNYTRAKNLIQKYQIVHLL